MKKIYKSLITIFTILIVVSLNACLASKPNQARKGLKTKRSAKKASLIKEATEMQMRDCEFLGTITATAKSLCMTHEQCNQLAIKEGKKKAVKKGASHYVLKGLIPGGQHGPAQASIQSYKCQTKESLQEESKAQPGESSI